LGVEISGVFSVSFFDLFSPFFCLGVEEEEEEEGLYLQLEISESLTLVL